MRRVRDIDAVFVSFHAGKPIRKEPGAPTLFERFGELWMESHPRSVGLGWMLGALVYDDSEIVTATFEESEAA